MQLQITRDLSVASRNFDELTNPLVGSSPSMRVVISVKPDTEISRAVGEMLSKRINCLPVVDDNNNVCGIITSTDLLKTYRSMQESLEKRTKSLKSAKKK
jgi:CBS-domain-containing membrane protein